MGHRGAGNPKCGDLRQTWAGTTPYTPGTPYYKYKLNDPRSIENHHQNFFSVGTLSLEYQKPLKSAVLSP